MRTLPLILHLYERASSRRAFRRELPALFSHLSVDDGHELGRQALALFDQQHRRVAEEILLYLAMLVPGALEGLHRGLLVRRILDAPELYRGADPATRDTFIQLICTGPWHEGGQLEALLRAFAWIGDGEVVEAFARWRRRPPAWSRALAHPPEDYTEVAGWTLTAAPEDERRDLFASTCLRLVPDAALDDEGAVAGAGAFAVRSGHRLGATCPHCRLPLLCALELPRQAVEGVLASFGGGAGLGERLVVPTCARCSRDGILFARVDEGAVVEAVGPEADITRETVDTERALPGRLRSPRGGARSRPTRSSGSGPSGSSSRSGRSGPPIAPLPGLPGLTVRPRHPRLDPRAPFLPLPSGTLWAVGPRRSPFETHRDVFAGGAGGGDPQGGRSQLGGHPGWLEEIIYPRCPGCDERMPFIAGLDLGDLAGGGEGAATQTYDGPDFAEGIVYAFLCLPCRTSATIAQGRPVEAEGVRSTRAT